MYLTRAAGASRLGPDDLALSAAAGIPHFWRHEQDPPELVHALDEPFAVRFRLDALLGSD